MPRSRIRLFYWVIQATQSSLDLAIFEERPRKGSGYFHLFLSCFIQYMCLQGPEEMYLSLEHQNPSKTSEKIGYFDRVTVSLHIL